MSAAVTAEEAVTATVLLVGAGAVGARAARQLVDTEGIGRLFVADRDTRRAEEVAAIMGPAAMPMPWDPLSPLPDGLSAVACALPAELDEHVVRAAVAAGVPCASAGDDAVGTRALLALHELARAAGVVVAAGAGLAPGLSDVLARHAAGALDVVDEVLVARAGSAGESCTAALRRARRERPTEIRDGVLREMRRRGGHELVWFPDPVGARDCELVAPGVELLGAAFPGVDRVLVRFAEPTAGPRLHWPRRADPEGSWGAVRVEVWGRRGPVREPIVYGAIERTAIAAGTVLAVTTAGLAGALPAVVAPATPGVHGLAAVAEPRPFLAELAKRGVKAAAFEGVPVA